MGRMFNGNWAFVLATGIAAVLFGLLAILLPGLILRTVILVFAVYVLLDGALLLTIGFRARRSDRAAMWQRIKGAASVLAGLAALFLPDVTALVLLIVIAVWAIVTGISELVTAIHLRRERAREWVLGLVGILTILVGIVLLMRPTEGAAAIIRIVGVYAVVVGLVRIVLSRRLQRQSMGPRI